MALAAAKARVFEPASIRSMFIRVSPIPQALSERRALLRALQKYGEIEVFKRLIDPASFISTSAHSSTVERLVENSPLQFDIIPEQDGNLAASPLSQELAFGSELGAAGSAFEKTEAADKTTYTLHIFRSQTYKHKTLIRHSPLHGPWPDERPSSFATSALRLVVPKDMAARGLWDWETGGQSERGGPGRPDKVNHIQDRMQRRARRSRGTSQSGLGDASSRPSPEAGESAPDAV